MNNKEKFNYLAQEVDFLIAERRHSRARGVHLIVTHCDHVTETLCAPGEMISDIALGGFPEPLSLRLAHMSLLLMDCLCRYRTPLSAQGIEQIMNSDPFYLDYAANRLGYDQVIAKPDRHTVRIYVSRIRKQLERTFNEIGLRIAADQVLFSELADARTALYRLKGTIEIRHNTIIETKRKTQGGQRFTPSRFGKSVLEVA